MADIIEQIVQFLKTKIGARVPDVGIICGSGLSHLADSLTEPVVVKYEEIDGFPQSTVQGHVGELVFGNLGAKFVVCMKGRFHYYEGYAPAQIALPVRVMAALGIKVLVVTNAAGGVNPNFNIGDLMIIRDQIALPGMAGNHCLVGKNDDRFGPRFPPVSTTFDKDLQAHVVKCAEEVKFNTLQKGCYFAVSGPTYETPHEIGMIRKLGGDSVGMSTIFEVMAAAHCDIKVLGLSLITNRCSGPDDNFIPPSHEEVLESVKAGEKDVQGLVSHIVKTMELNSYKRSKAFIHFNAPVPGGAASSSSGAKPLKKKCCFSKPCPLTCFQKITCASSLISLALSSFAVYKILSKKN